MKKNLFLNNKNKYLKSISLLSLITLASTIYPPPSSSSASTSTPRRTNQSPPNQIPTKDTKLKYILGGSLSATALALTLGLSIGIPLSQEAELEELYNKLNSFVPVPTPSAPIYGKKIVNNPEGNMFYDTIIGK